MVPAILEWPARIPKHRSTDIRCNTCDIYPTLLEIAGVKLKHQPQLDGISLVPIIDGQKLKSRPKGMGFWHYPIGGISTPSDAWMRKLLEAQKLGKEPDDKAKLRLNAADTSKRYSLTELPGHSAWIDGDWKLHRIADKKGNKVRYELYNLAKDRSEKTDLAKEEPARVQQMQAALLAWQQSVIRSLHGEDYKQ